MGEHVSMIGDYMSMAEACGEVTHHRAWVPGVDFDPGNPDELDVMRLVWENERYDRIAVLERENERLRALLGDDVDDE
jgi:hypothetical protein